MSQPVPQSKRSKIILLYAIYFALLSYLYSNYLAVYWGYFGYNLQYDTFSVLVGCSALLLFATAVPTSGDARSVLLNLFLSAYLVPSIVLTALGGQAFNSSIVIWVCSLILFWVSGLHLPSVKLGKASPAAFVLIIALLSLMLLLFFYFLGGFNNFNLDITRVYDFREEAEEDLPALFGYLSATFSKLVIPLGIVSALLYKFRSAAIGFSIVSILLFGLTSHKAIILYPIIAVVLYYSLAKSVDYARVLLLIIGAMAICLLDVYFLRVFGDGGIWGWFSSLFLRRALFVPPLIDFYYIEFFSQEAPLYWADSRLTFGMIPNPYGISAPYLVGDAYFGADTGANTGFIGSGFGQAGLVGSIVYSIGAGLVIALINAHARRQGVAFVTAIMAVPALTMFTSTDFITLFLSHGVLLGFLLLGVIERPDPTFGQRKGHGAGPVPELNPLGPSKRTEVTGKAT